MHLLLVAVETLGPFNETAYELVGDIGTCIVRPSGDDSKISFFVPAYIYRGATLSFSFVTRQLFGC